MEFSGPALASSYAPLPSGGEETRTNLIINYLPQAITDKELYSMFMTVGPLKSCKVMKDNRTGYSFGFGFVDFQRPEDAIRAIETLNGLDIMNKRIKVSYARPQCENIKEANLYVAGIPREYDESQLEQLFSPFGSIIQRNILKDKITGMSRGVGFVRFDTKDQAESAIMGLNGTIPPGGMENLKIKIAEDHARQRAPYSAGWTAGAHRGGAAGPVGAMRGQPNIGGSCPRGGMQVYNCAEGHSGVSGPSSLSGFSGAVRAERPTGRLNQMGYGGYQWN